jgi:hypothetical protein
VVTRCPVAFVRNNEEFPVFQALLNAIHRGVKVRIMTNDFGNECFPGMITPLDFLTLAGAQTTAFATLTFLVCASSDRVLTRIAHSTQST